MTALPVLRYLRFDASDGDDGVCTLEAMVSLRPGAQAAAVDVVLAEVQLVLQWTASQFPDEQGPVEDGFAWDHALLQQQEPGGWCTVTLTLVAAPHVAEALLARFGGNGQGGGDED